MKNKSYWIAGGLVLLAVLFGAYVSYSAYSGGNNKSPYASAALENLAQCIKAKGGIFYGAFWCPHCQATKAEFGAAAKDLPYVECSTPNGEGQTQICIDKGIHEYPTWVLPDGTRLTGERSLQELATSFSCPLPGGTATSTAQ